MVVSTTSTLEASMRTAVGSDGWVPRSRATSHRGALGVVPLMGKAIKVGSSVPSSTTASTKSCAPSRSTSDSSG